MKIATWNVNSLRARLPHVLLWLQAQSPDVVLLQETKTLSETMPREPLEDIGYNVYEVGQKTYNGVAILSKTPLEDLVTSLPGDSNDTEARYIQAFTRGWCLASVYVPNGQSVGSTKYDYKLKFLSRLRQHIEETLSSYPALVVGGDFNIAPTHQDVYDPITWGDQVLCSPEERQAFQSLLDVGLSDAFRHQHPHTTQYTWWDYRGGHFRKDWGLRIDHILLSRSDHILDAVIDTTPRSWERPSDHAPLWCNVKDIV